MRNLYTQSAHIRSVRLCLNDLTWVTFLFWKKVKEETIIKVNNRGETEPQSYLREAMVLWVLRVWKRAHQSSWRQQVGSSPRSILSVWCHFIKGDRWLFYFSFFFPISGSFLQKNVPQKGREIVQCTCIFCRGVDPWSLTRGPRPLEPSAHQNDGPSHRRAPHRGRQEYQ